MVDSSVSGGLKWQIAEFKCLRTVNVKCQVADWRLVVVVKRVAIALLGRVHEDASVYMINNYPVSAQH